MLEYCTFLKNEITPELLSELHRLETLCFGPTEQRRIQEDSLEYKKNPLLILAKQDQEYVGFKLGYERRKGRFYSWMGGVVPAVRRQGVGRALMEKQHQVVSSLGYTSIRTQSSNAFRGMLILNLLCGFDIVGTFVNPKTHSVRILFEKDLQPNQGPIGCTTSP